MKSNEVLFINICSGAAGVVLHATGRITIDTSPALRERLISILRKPAATLTIDLSDVLYIDTSGLATLLEALKFARLGDTALRLKLHERPRYLMEVSGLLPLFDETSEEFKC
jgi:anti-sigma B factor antagonist